MGRTAEDNNDNVFKLSRMSWTFISLWAINITLLFFCFNIPKILKILNFSCKQISWELNQAEYWTIIDQ